MTLPLKRKTRKLLIIAIPPVAVIAVLIAVYCGISLSASRSDMILLSDLSFLGTAFSGELMSYFKREGRYPENLDVLGPKVVKDCYTTNDPNQLKEELELLSHFKYSSDGNTYTLIWSIERKHFGTVHIFKQYGKNGIMGKRENYTKRTKKKR